ncbi:MAG: response regulator transcription factor [Acidobacteria bacterium]|nr:response regulator transcription factor [Acidobacteriota bacterium]
MKPGTVFACDAQPIVIEGLERVLGATADLQFAGWASNPAEALRRIGELRPDLALIDQSQGFRGALQLVSSLRDVCVTTQPVLWIGEMADSEALRALQFGARGVVRKTLPTSSLLECLRAVLGGQVWIENGLANHAAGLLARRGAPRLTSREREIVRLICRGMKNRQIAESLQITPGTVKVHLMHVFEKGRGLLGAPPGADTRGFLLRRFAGMAFRRRRLRLDGFAGGRRHRLAHPDRRVCIG